MLRKCQIAFESMLPLTGRQSKIKLLLILKAVFYLGEGPTYHRVHQCPHCCKAKKEIHLNKKNSIKLKFPVLKEEEGIFYLFLLTGIQ